jgi:hypothetical protein
MLAACAVRVDWFRARTAVGHLLTGLPEPW